MPSINELNPFTFEDTGITVQIRKVSPLLIMEVQKAMPVPKPPMQEVVYGDPNDPGAKKVKEPNETHPDYMAAIEKYNMDLEQMVRKFMISRGVVITLDEEQKADVKELREEWKEEFGVELNGNDKFLFISYVAIGTDADMEELMDVIMRRSQPTEAEMSSVKAGFQGKIPRERHLEDSSSEIGDNV